MDQCFKNRNLMVYVGEYLTFIEAYKFSCTNQVLRKVLQSDEIWWPLYFREYDYRIVDRKTGGALLAYIYCSKHLSELQNFQCSKKLTLGILGTLSQLHLPAYLAKKHFEFFDMFSKPVIRKRETFEITALSLPNSSSLEFEREYTDCFLLCLNSQSEQDLSALRQWLEDLDTFECLNFLVVANGTSQITSALPELKALNSRAVVIAIEELSEKDINTVLSQILRCARRRKKGLVSVPALPPPPEPPTHEQKRRWCQLI